MPKKAKELSATEVRRITKPGVHSVGGVAGLCLRVEPTGSKRWFLRFTVGDKRRDAGLGGYPEVPLKEARESARELKKAARQGIDPIADRQAARAALMAAQANAITFNEAVEGFLEAKGGEWRNPKHRKQWEATLATYAGPVIGSMPVESIEKTDVLRVLKPIWNEKPETASRVRQRIERVFHYAKSAGYRDGENPALWRNNLEHALSKLPKPDSQPRLDYKRLPEFMSKLKSIETMQARMLEFAILIGGRPGAARLARWDQIDFDAQLFLIDDAEPGFKSYRETRLVLNDAVMALLKQLPRFDSCPYVFASPSKKAFADTSPNCVIKDIMHPEQKAVDGIGWVDTKKGRRIVAHGFRSSFKDWARECTAYPDEVSELQLMHGKADKTRDAYARSALIDLRRRLMTDWAQYLAGQNIAGEVVSIRGAQA